jgi:hypothetical protein
VRVRWAEGEAPVVRRYAETRYGAVSWKCERRVAGDVPIAVEIGEAGVTGLRTYAASAVGSRAG